MRNNKGVGHKEGREGPQQSFCEHEGVCWPQRKVLSKAAGGRISSFIHLYFMDKAVQERRHAQAPGGRVFLAKKRFRACKKIPVPLLWFVLLKREYAESVCSRVQGKDVVRGRQWVLQ